MTTSAATHTRDKVRTCVACRAQSDKKSLYRVVKSPDGFVTFDPTGKAAGRGAYVCSAECFRRVRNSGRLAAALKTSLELDDYDRIARDLDDALRLATKIDEE